MKYLVIAVSVLTLSPIATPSAKSEKEVYIESASQFQRWCKKSSYRHLKKKKLQPFNWSASTIRQLNDYQTTGSWRVKRSQKKVFCQIRIGKMAKTIKIKID